MTTIEEGDDPKPGRSRTFTVRFFETPITTTVTSSPAIVRSWVHATRYFYRQYRHSSRLVVGLGVQWEASYRRGVSNPAATLQLCVGRRCLIFQLIHATAFPRALVRFLSDPDVTFVGIRNGSDSAMLESHGLQVETVDLRYLAEMPSASMEEMISRFLGFDHVHKSESTGRSKWGKTCLSKKQVRYACVDAYVSFQIGLILKAWKSRV